MTRLLYTALYMAATRTQIYLTNAQRRRLDELTKKEGRSLAALIREALDRYLDEQGGDSSEALDATFGAVKDIEVPSRDEWDRG